VDDFRDNSFRFQLNWRLLFEAVIFFKFRALLFIAKLSQFSSTNEPRRCPLMHQYEDTKGFKVLSISIEVFETLFQAKTRCMLMIILLKFLKLNKTHNLETKTFAGLVHSHCNSNF
jgi:hypothetical protein